MNYITKTLLSGMCLLALMPSARAETLTEAMAFAYGNNPELLAKRSYLSSVYEKMPQAKAGFKPTVSMGGSASSRHTETNSGTDSDTTPYSASISLSQPIFNGFSTLHGIKSADYTIKSEQANMRSTEQNILLDAVTAYMNLVRDEAVLKLRINNEQVLSRKLEATNDRYKVGEITKTDVAQAEARLMQAQAARILAEGELETSKANYVKVIGHSPANIEEEPKLFADMLPSSLDDAIKMGLENNPSIVSAKHSLTVAEEDIGIAKADLLPTVSLNGSAGRSWNQNSSNDSTDSLQITANLEIPLYTAGVASSKVRSAKYITGQKRNDLTNEIESVREEVTSAYKSLSATRASIRATISQVDAAEIALEGVEKEAEVGSRTLLDVLDAEQELLDAKVSLVEAKRDETVISATLLAAVGQFSAADIGLKK
ncbi:MAG: TolC family outer membrane protein [Alphaproteobacteria bacterium]